MYSSHELIFGHFTSRHQLVGCRRWWRGVCDTRGYMARRPGGAKVTSRAAGAGSAGTPRTAARAARTLKPQARRIRNASNLFCSL